MRLAKSVAGLGNSKRRLWRRATNYLPLWLPSCAVPPVNEAEHCQSPFSPIFLGNFTTKADAVRERERVGLFGAHTVSGAVFVDDGGVTRNANLAVLHERIRDSLREI